MKCQERRICCLKVEFLCTTGHGQGEMAHDFVCEMRTAVRVVTDTIMKLFITDEVSC